MPREKITASKGPRPPVIVVTGHIDHGKSTLLDYIRKTNVTATEAGGITQHISAYEAEHKTAQGMRRITFLDTPGHEAFSGMRRRGVSAADIAILVVSAEDSVKAQTVEALTTIKESGLPYIVAINKMDKQNANPDKVKTDLMEHEVFVEGFGGSVPVVPVSAVTGAGIPELLDMIVLLADMQELSGDAGKPGEGVVIESHLDKKRGASATLVVRDGTVRRGDFLLVGNVVSPVRIMEDFAGRPAAEAGPSKPVGLAGLAALPKAGATFTTYGSKKEAESAAESAVVEAVEVKPFIHEDENRAIVPIIVKADTLGTLEAVEKEVGKLVQEGVFLKVIQKGVGPFGEGDIKLALGSPGVLVVGFGVKAERDAADLALRSGIELHLFDIVYKLTEWLEEELKGRKPKVDVEETLGTAKIVRIFSRDKERQVMGGRVLEGALQAGGRVKIVRRNVEIGQSKIIELQQQKLKAKEVAAPNEFGMMIESEFDVAEGDTIEAFTVVRK